MPTRAIAVTISGLVQGVGFRPSVHQLATRLGLSGLVKNETGDVVIEAEGPFEAIDTFLSELTSHPPALSRIDNLRIEPRQPRNLQGFRIESSRPSASPPSVVTPDLATCDDCLRELFDPLDRRFRYPFLACARCGPRFTILSEVPFDRERTCMTDFPLCADCEREYLDPLDRRFHAQTLACPACGPRLQALDSLGHPVETQDPLAWAIHELLAGRILAIKGLGGYHLACLAANPASVASLRLRKHRDDKPLALLVRDLASARQLAHLDPAETALLTSPRRPIVLLRRKPGANLADNVAPFGNPDLGLMLPYTPLHHLLSAGVRGTPLVLTSANLSGEPIVHDDHNAVARLGSIADGFLAHNRRILVPCDDSVTRLFLGSEQLIRRSRGDVPLPIILPRPCARPTLALGGQLKATFALGLNHLAILSQHLGDLDSYQAHHAYLQAIQHAERLWRFRPERLVLDMHPDYASSAYARARSGTVSTLSVQHHHAHMASVMAEHGLSQPVIGVTFDGTGYGLDGSLWGGEFLVGDDSRFRRAAHLRPLGMPGGEQAIREPWRMAAAYLLDAGLDLAPLEPHIPASSLAVVRTLLERRVQTPSTSSAGRLFDAVSAILNLRTHASFEGQAAIELEWLARNAPHTHPYDFEIQKPSAPSKPLQLDLRPAIRAIQSETRRNLDRALIASRFHHTLASAIASVCDLLRESSNLNQVVLSGGVFLNAVLSERVQSLLTRLGFQVYRHQKVPPSDAGLSLGQLAIASAIDARANPHEIHLETDSWGLPNHPSEEP